MDLEVCFVFFLCVFLVPLLTPCPLVSRWHAAAPAAEHRASFAGLPLLPGGLLTLRVWTAFACYPGPTQYVSTRTTLSFLVHLFGAPSPSAYLRREPRRETHFTLSRN